MQRDWAKYNEQLVKRGEFYLCLDFLDKNHAELEQMNSKKCGRPFAYADSFIRFTAFLRVAFSLEYRQTEGVLRALSKYVPQIDCADYTTLWRRSIKLNFTMPKVIKDPSRVVIVDGTGIKTTNRGDWRSVFYERRKNWLKVNIAIDENTGELLGIDIASGPQHDSKSFEKIVQDVSMSVLKGDGAFDKKSIFNYCDKNKITPAIKVRKSSIPRSRGSPLRKRCVRELKELGEEAWKEKYDYGKRWLVESYFSAVKRSYGEAVKSRRSDMMVKEAMIKFLLYATVREIA